MTNKVVTLGIVPRASESDSKAESVDNVIRTMVAKKLVSVVMFGTDSEGTLHYMFSEQTKAEALWDMEIVKQNLLRS